MADLRITGSGVGPTSYKSCETCLERGAEPFDYAAQFFGSYGMKEVNFMKVKEVWKDNTYLTIFDAVRKYPEELGELYREFVDGFPESLGLKSEIIADVMEHSHVSAIDELMELGSRSFSGEKCDIDILEAYYYFRKAAEMGSAKAQIALASIYESEDLGEKIFENHAKQVGWLSVAEKQNSPKAMRKLGEVYLKGFHKDEMKAFEYFKNTIQQCDKNSGDHEITRTVALCFLGKMYRHGLGIQKNLEHAFCIWSEAINTNEDFASYLVDELEDNGITDNLKKLEQEMTKAQIKSAAKMSYKTVLGL